MTHLQAKSPSPHHLIRYLIYPKPGHFILCLKSLVPPHILKMKSWFLLGPCSGPDIPFQPCLLPSLPWPPPPWHTLSHATCLHMLYPLPRMPFLPLPCLVNKLLFNP